MVVSRVSARSRINIRLTKSIQPLHSERWRHFNFATFSLNIISIFAYSDLSRNEEFAKVWINLEMISETSNPWITGFEDPERSTLTGTDRKRVLYIDRVLLQTLFWCTCNILAKSFLARTFFSLLTATAISWSFVLMSHDDDDDKYSSSKNT